MRTAALLPLLVSVLSLAAGAAQAQAPSSPSEDEQILKPGSGQPAPSEAKPEEDERPKQSRKDDDLDDEELDEQVFYSGMGVSRVGSDYVNLGEAINLEGVIGFRIPTVPWFGLEIDIGQTIIPGQNTPEVQSGCGGVLQPPCPGATGDPDEFAMQALGLSLALKSTGPFYVTGKYGYRYLLTSIEDLDDKRSGTGFGIGVGYRWGRGLSGVELGYRQLGEDVESIGLTFFVRTSQR
jgi:hypothetical protein